MRVSCRLASGPSFDSSTSSNLCRICSGPRWISTGSARKASAQRSMVSVADHGSSRKIASGSTLRTLAIASARSRSSAVRRASVGGGRRDRGEEAAADDVDAERPRLIIVDEGADMRAGSDQKDALRRNQPGGARVRGDAHDEKALDDQCGKRGGIEQHDPGARILAALLCVRKPSMQQADQRHVPQLDGAPGVRLEGEKIRQPVFAAEHVGNGENARRQHADLEERGNVAGIAIGGEGIGDAGGARHRHDQRNVEQKDRAGKRAARQHRPGAQEAARSAAVTPACSSEACSSARLAETLAAAAKGILRIESAPLPRNGTTADAQGAMSREACQRRTTNARQVARAERRVKINRRARAC